VIVVFDRPMSLRVLDKHLAFNSIDWQSPDNSGGLPMNEESSLSTFLSTSSGCHLYHRLLDVRAFLFGIRSMSAYRLT
jgi:hypothetical protein